MSRNVSKSPEVVGCPGDVQDEVCVVCFRPVEVYSVGECDHPVCYECSTRMRVLCARNECPICRKEMSKVVFTREVIPFVSIQTRNMHYERRYAIFFENEGVMRAYDFLLEHRCKACDDMPVFRNFTQLKDHMRKYHERFYCELCVDHLKIFTHERRSYSRSQLAQHRRKGDTDDRSHRGHPLCEFCDARFMDNDELFRHLRRDHFFCHFCDADGSHQYYDDYNALRKHFRTDHYLCEEGDCQEERFTSVFRTKLDLQAHCTQNHSQNMTKQAARQARTVDIEFTLNPRPQDSHRQEERGGRGSRGGRGRGGRGGRRDRERDFEDSRIPDEVDSRPPPNQHQIDINCVQDFPSLNSNGPGSGGEAGGASGSKSMATHLAQQNRFTIRARGRTNLLEEEFPSLRSGSTSVTVSAAPATSQSPSSPTTSVHLKVNTKKPSRDAQGSNSRSSNVSIQYNRTVPAATNEAKTPSSEGDSSRGAGPQIGVISHSSNITLQSTGSGKPKSKSPEEDFPALVTPKTKVSGQSSSGWGSAMAQPSNSVPNKVTTKVFTNDFPSLGPSLGAPSTTSSKPGKKFNAKDFPTLAPNSESQTHMQNYHGHSSVTIPVSNAWTHSVDHMPKPTEPNENLMGSKGKKKKKGPNKPATQNNQGSGGNTAPSSLANGTSKPKAAPKKKPLGLHNIFDDSDDEEAPKINLSMGKLGDYESLAPQQGSNVKMITQESLTQERKKSELKIGTLKSPPVMDSDEAFPTLGAPTPSPLTTSTWSSPAKKSAPPGFSGKPKVPPGFSATDMTFTSSSGEKFAISPTSEGAVSTDFTQQPRPPSLYSFARPPDFEQRNKNLIRTIQNECQGEEEKFAQFKYLANQLRSGELSGQVYYESCRSMMGKETFLKILPELLVLLPDIKNQQEVLGAYRKVDGGRGCSTLFAVCVVCRQVLSQGDFAQHMELHDNVAADFPSLSQASSHILKK
ncbi:E3 ubiquitin-protein ligase ZNF598-like [Portunus trituberculatus]|uniref:E3 ubiquitin-protein ligase ZNF598-like n=1 Tax=Portunus trituberculatus TaxID=210409 RepID=UPI001E1D14DE|nr:E3 ubiquitin-protein ligase ZNF598-like [Portunus trituberculatus]